MENGVTRVQVRAAEMDTMSLAEEQNRGMSDDNLKKGERI